MVSFLVMFVVWKPDKWSFVLVTGWLSLAGFSNRGLSLYDTLLLLWITRWESLPTLDAILILYSFRNMLVPLWPGKITMPMARPSNDNGYTPTITTILCTNLDMRSRPSNCMSIEWWCSRESPTSMANPSFINLCHWPNPSLFTC